MGRDFVMATRSAPKPSDRNLLSRILGGYSAEVTTPDRKSLDAAAALMPNGSRVYIAGLPKDPPIRQVETAIRVRELGLEPVPHLVARNVNSRAAFEDHLAQLSEKAKVDRALVLGGDRDDAAGEFDSALSLIETGLFEKFGIDKIAIGCYPEGHPRIPDDVLRNAMFDKLAEAEKQGLQIILISQLCFDAERIIHFVRGLRETDVKARFRVGVAGPATPATLVKYAMICGVGPSLRAMKERQDTAKNLLAGETPEALLTDIARAHFAEPELDIWGIHFFTFSALKKTIEWAESNISRE